MDSSSSTSSVKKTSSSSNCRVKDLQKASKRAELNKLYKKVERVSKRIFHAEKPTSTFVPSQLQHQYSASSSTGSSVDPQMPHQPVIVNPPYPVHPGFGTGFLPPLPSQQVPHVPPSYGWALNGIESPSLAPNQSSSAFGALSLDVDVGNETSGSGFDHLPIHQEDDDDIGYLRRDPSSDLKKAQAAKLERVKQRIIDDVTEMSLIQNDAKQLNDWFDSKYVHLLVDEDAMTTEELEEKVRGLEEKLRRLRAKTPMGGPPPRPPPPRSISQESSTGPWHCARCRTENRPDVYRCSHCSLPSRRFDPWEVARCGCEYCSTAIIN
ncbi:unnamed protein product [Caenorhabditis sp. 36 PRJEB53466]|nr:unnamed protein product [Caenorhabditis sp. 36 PRJEB53466]